MTLGASVSIGPGDDDRGSFSIGEVLSRLRAQFPDVTISKIRFLETEGLVEPQRTPAGYRKFSTADVERLRYVLECQRDHYLPLRVIRTHLAAMDRGEPPPPSTTGEPAEAAAAGPVADRLPTAESFSAADPSEIRLTRGELAQAAGLESEQLQELERFGLLATRTGSSSYDGNALVVARTVAQLARFGVEPRHLRSFKTAADREIGLIEQIVSPYARQRGAEARDRAQGVVAELAALSVRLHAALVRAGLSADLRR